MNQETLKVDSSSLFDNFNDHVEINDNDRIFFSGPFGTGKTTFLKDYFATKVDVYEVFHLYPINYQIKNNDDVFDLIKYDILTIFLNRYPDAFNKQQNNLLFEQILMYSSFFKESFTTNKVLTEIIDQGINIAEVVDSLLSTKLNQIGKPLKDLLVFDEKLQQYKSDYKDGEAKITIREFLENKDVNETDIISHLLKDKLNELDKKTVLIIDDLDRIDPQHIFRILNVISAFHELEGSNKFGFDKIILVGDKNNLKKIFHHFYGEKTDFKGYISKFFSYKYYEFSNLEIISNEIAQILKKFGEEVSTDVKEFKKGYWIHDLLLHFISGQMKTDSPYSVRELIKLDKFSNAIVNDIDIPSFKKSQTENKFEAIKLCIDVCTIILGGKEELKKQITHLKNNESIDQTTENFYKYYSYPLLYKVSNTEFYNEVFTSPAMSIDGYIVERLNEEAVQVSSSSTKKGARNLFYDLLLAII